MKKGKYYKRKKKNILLKILILFFVISTLITIYYLYNQNKNQNENKELDEYIKEDYEIEDKITDRMIKVEQLQQENSDVIGWIEIENSNISYPVLQSKENNKFYLNHNYKKEYSKQGSLFLDEKFDLDLPSTNYLIYGHNNRGNNEMFAGLMNYKNKSYYNTHKNIRFTTNREDSIYDILAVFYSRVYYKNETNVFRYYYFVNAKNEEEYNDFVKNAKEVSIYETGVNASYGEQLLTLSTCEYSQVDGRFVIVSKKKNTQ